MPGSNTAIIIMIIIAISFTAKEAKLREVKEFVHIHTVRKLRLKLRMI